jgi:hypothetical protein
MTWGEAMDQNPAFDTRQNQEFDSIAVCDREDATKCNEM